MAEWQVTIGKARGSYARAGIRELYVRESPDVPGAWRWTLDGILMGVTGGESSARAAAEAAVRAMARAHASRSATAAKKCGAGAA